MAAGGKRLEGWDHRMGEGKGREGKGREGKGRGGISFTLSEGREGPFVPDHFPSAVPPLRDEFVGPLEARLDCLVSSVTGRLGRARAKGGREGERRLTLSERVPRRHDGDVARYVRIGDRHAALGALSVAAGRDRGVDAETFVDDAVEMGQRAQRHRIVDVDRVEFGAQLFLMIAVQGQFVEEEDQGRGNSVAGESEVSDVSRLCIASAAGNSGHLPAMMIVTASPYSHGRSASSEFVFFEASINHCETSGLSAVI